LGKGEKSEVRAHSSN